MIMGMYNHGNLIRLERNYKLVTLNYKQNKEKIREGIGLVENHKVMGLVEFP